MAEIDLKLKNTYPKTHFMKTLYHYCTVESLFSILTSRTIRLGDATKMNDSHESIWMDKQVAQLLKRQGELISVEDQQNFSMAYEMNRPRPFIFCLSQEPDILSQWRAYAGDGTGVSIGFNTDLFPKQKHLPSTNIAPSMNTALWQIIYDEKTQIGMLEALFDAALDSTEFSEKGKINYQLIGAFIAGLSPTIKNPAFREELEWRLIHTPHLLTNLKNEYSSVGTQYKIGQRVSNNQIITYFEYPLTQESMPAINEVWIGPRSRLTEADIKLLFSINGYGDIQVKFSSATYR